jgi:Zn-dependent protease
VGGIRIGRVGQVPVRLRASWFVIAVLITVLYAPAVRGSADIGAGAYLVAFGFAFILLLSVFVHELAHAGVAAATGTPATEIVLDVWGGHTAFAEESAGPWRSVAVSIIGPVSNAAIAAVAYAAFTHAHQHDVTRLLLIATATSNAFVAVFNALPGLPLDGGRVLEALVWRATGDRAAGTLAAGWTGRVLAVALAVATIFGALSGGRLWSSAIWLILVAGLLWHGAGQAIAAGHWTRRAAELDIGDLLQPAVAVASTATVATALLAARDAGAAAVVVLDVYGRPASIVDERAAAGVPPARADQVTAAAVAHALPAGGVVPRELTGDELIDRLQESPTDRYAVLGEDDLVIGVLDYEDVARYVTRS